MRESCKSRHVGPFSVGVHRAGEFRCENCDAVLNGVEVYLDTTEHAEDGKKVRQAREFDLASPVVALPPAPGVSTLGL
jgi:hypothetical protein